MRIFADATVVALSAVLLMATKKPLWLLLAPIFVLYLELASVWVLTRLTVLESPLLHGARSPFFSRLIAFFTGFVIAFFPSSTIPMIMMSVLYTFRVAISSIFAPLGQSSEPFTRLLMPSQADQKVQQLELEVDALQNRLFRDGLTHLGNREAFNDILSRHENSTGYAVLLIDVDNFKRVNDTLGHLGGDLALKELAARMHLFCQTNSARMCTPYRLAGDEFAIFFSHPIHETRDVTGLCNALKQDILKTMSIEGVSVTFSCGLAIHSDGERPIVIVDRADSAMYYSKNSGKNRLCLWEPAMPSKPSVATDEMVRSAILNHEFTLNFQPLVSYELVHWSMTLGPRDSLVKSGEIISAFEALVRFSLPIPLSEILMRARATNTLRELSLRIIELSAQFSVEARADVHVNLPVDMLDSPEITSALIRAASASGCRVHVELTEDVDGALFSGAIADQMNRLGKQGIKFSIDDFGSGFNAFRSLHLAGHPDAVKIDSAYLHDVVRGGAYRSGVLLKHMMGIAQDYKMECVIEGVETIDHLVAVQQIIEAKGSQLSRSRFLLQGFFFFKPMSHHEAVSLYKTRKNANKENILAS